MEIVIFYFPITLHWSIIEKTNYCKYFKNINVNFTKLIALQYFLANLNKVLNYMLLILTLHYKVLFNFDKAIAKK